jgi:3D (Asp-Asp-Asp) domain-containing protein
MGSKVYINAGQWSGVYTVGDTGGAIKGKRIDIWSPAAVKPEGLAGVCADIFSTIVFNNK